MGGSTDPPYHPHTMNGVFPDVRDSEATVRAAGGLVWRRGNQGFELALIRRDRYGSNEWSLPKGKLDPGETYLEAAIREVEEETGIRARPLRFAGVMQYLVKGENKVVCFWDMEALEQGHAQMDGEVAEVRWVTREEALSLLTHEQNRELLRHLPLPPL